MPTNLTLIEPYNRCVYQRNHSGIASIPVSGTVPAGINNVTATFTPVNGGNITTQTLPVDKDGNFGGTVSVPGGWYSLAVSAGSMVALVNRVGSGEVFVCFGHSFIQGGHDLTHQLPSTDERVITLSDDLTSRNFQFEQLTTKVGPFSVHPDWMGQFGDKMVRRLGVPVLMYGAAYGGSNIKQNYEVINALPRTGLPPGTSDPASRQPFLPMETVMTYYVPKTGVRAVLCEHGYNDRGTDRNTFASMFRNVFDYIRRTWSKPELAVVLVQEELQNPPAIADPETAQGIKLLIDSYPYTWKGPDFNNPIWQTPGFHANNDHLAGGGIDEFANEWASALSDYFFQQSTPYSGDTTPNVFPAVLYNAPTGGIAAIDWALILLAGLVLMALFVKKSKYLMWAFLALALLGLGRVTGKI